jgi:pimeloyl-ACP methyl ester carboxylesterase
VTGPRLEHIVRNPESAKPTPVVFVHGAWHGAWCWEEHFLAYFADHGYECHAFSFRNHGGSESPRSLRTTRIDHYVEDLASVVDGLDAPPLLVGHSMGGLVVQRYLEQRTLPGAVLLAPVPVGGALRATFRVAARHPVAFAKVQLTLRLWPIVETPDLARDAFFADDMAAADVERQWSRLQDESYFAYTDMIAFRRPRPGRVATPVLIVGGEADTLFSPAEMQKTAGAYGTTAVMIPDAAHDLMLDGRWQEAADAMLDWFAGLGS